ncbi:MAG TPA: efflux RND transporter permease subunit [Steroidobacteraceae bacterium]|nr:efflux RND transporter permease subunit [Steroidobacteraceae bacterium]
MHHTRLALQRPVTTIMVALAVLAVGIISTKLLRLEAMPDITFPGMQVIIPFPGSTPEEMELLVVRPVEEALATLSGIEEIRATAGSDQAQFTVLFDWDRDPETAAFEVRTKIDSIRSQLPAAADRVLMFAFSASDEPVIVIRIASDQDLTDQYDTLEKFLKRPIERLDGVARVELEGVQPRELRVLVDPDRIAAYGIDVQALRTLLERSNFSVSAGEITENGQRFTVRPIGEFRTIADVRELIVRDNVRLSDVAQVALVAPDLPIGRHIDGRPAVGIDVYKSTQANVVDVADRVLAAVDEARAAPQLQGIEILVVGNQADSIRQSLHELRNAGLIGAGLSFIMLLLFLRHLPTTLIVSLAVPASLLVTLGAMYFLGFTLNILTMMGMLLAIGMLVDNSVVITESIFRHRQLNPGNPVEATVSGVKEVGIATLAGTFSTIIVFLPLVFGEKNQMSIFLVHVAVPIVIAMVASLVVAQTLIPMLAARMPPPPGVSETSLFGRLQRRYTATLAWALDHPKWMALATVLLLVSPVPLFALKLAKVDPFPQEASRTVFLAYHLNGSYPMDRVEQAVNRIEAYIEANRERFDVDTYYSVWLADEAYTRLYLKPKEEATVPAAEVMRQISEGLPEIIIGKPSFQFEQGAAGSTNFTLQLAGESTERLATISHEVARRLSSVPGLEAVRSEAGTGDEEVQVIVNRDRAAQLGVTTQQVALTVTGAMRGDKLPELRATDREITMRLAFRESDRQSVEDLAKVPIMLPDGSRTELGAVADFQVRPSDREIERVNRLTTVIVNANLAKGTTMEDARKRVEPIMNDYPLPAGYSWKFGRGFDENEKAVQTMAQNMALAVVLIFLVMAALFESTLYPLSIITSILFAIVGSIWFLTLTGTTITMMAMIGFMILIGVVVNIGIVLIAHVIDLREAGFARRDAIMQAGRDRLRPIVMTVLTTLLGMMPLAIGDAQIGGSGQGPAYYPMARAIIGGLGFSALVSLLIVPMFYVWFDDLNLWRRRVFSARPALAGTGVRPGPLSAQRTSAL